MTNDEMLNHIITKIDRLGVKIEGLRDEFAEHRVRVEHRLTKVEVKSSIFGTVGGVVGGFLASLLHVGGK